MVVSGKIMNNTKLHNFNVKSLFFIILTILFLNHEVVYSHALEDKNEIEDLIESWIEQNPDKIRLITLRSFGESFYHSITDASLEFGYKAI